MVLQARIASQFLAIVTACTVGLTAPRTATANPTEQTPASTMPNNAWTSSPPRIAGRGQVIAGWIMFGGGLAATITGATYTIAASSIADNQESNGGTSNEDAIRTVGIAVMAIGGVVGITGLIVATTGHSKMQESIRARKEWEKRKLSWEDINITPIPMKNGGGASLAFRF